MSSSRPMSFTQIAEQIAGQIRSGELAPGEQLPSYNQLAEQYGVSYATAHRVITILRAQGLIRSEPGRGVYVAGESGE